MLSLKCDICYKIYLIRFQKMKALYFIGVVYYINVIKLIMTAQIKYRTGSHGWGGLGDCTVENSPFLLLKWTTIISTILCHGNKKCYDFRYQRKILKISFNLAFSFWKLKILLDECFYTDSVLSKMDYNDATSRLLCSE